MKLSNPARKFARPLTTPSKSFWFGVNSFDFDSSIERKPSKKSRPRLEPQDPVELNLDQAREAALRVLTRSSKSSFELRTLSETKGASPEIAQTVVQRFLEVELLDDAKLARAIVNTRIALKGESSRLIRRELEKRRFGNLCARGSRGHRQSSRA
jgi:hypothetical protein